MDTYILVSGVDYFNFTGIFSQLAKDRKKEIIENEIKNPSEELKFIFFDFKSGKVTETITKITKEGKKKKVIKEKETEIARYQSISRENYKRSPNFRGTMSITHVYDKICEIGKNAPGTLKELSFFSHSYKDGPILVNSTDRYDMYINVRDPDDRDARIRDFVCCDAIKNHDLFKKAFHKDGFSWIWGCTVDDELKDLINLIRKQSGKRDNIPDSATFTLYHKNHKRLFRNYGVIDQLPSGPLIVTFAQIKALLCIALKNTYAYNLALTSDKKVYATFVGVGAKFEEKPPAPGRKKLMRSDPDRKKIIEFYKKYLKIKTDPTGRNYAEYLPNLPCESYLISLYKQRGSNTRV